MTLDILVLDQSNLKKNEETDQWEYQEGRHPMNQHIPHQRSRVTEEPISPERVAKASRAFCRAVQDLNTDSRFVHDQIRAHMGVQ